MRMRKRKKSIEIGKEMKLIGLALAITVSCCFYACYFLASQGTSSGTSIANLGIPVGSLSNDIANPQLLNDGINDGESFTPAVDEFYYRSNSSIVASAYSAFTVYSSQIDVDMAFYTHVLPHTSTLRGTFIGSTANLKWMVFHHPSMIPIGYSLRPRVNTTGATGNGWVEWEQSTSLSLSGSTTISFYNQDDFIELVHCTMPSSVPGYIYLDVPVGCQYDLHAYKVASSACVRGDAPDYSSASGSTGVNEVLCIDDPGAEYVIVIARYGTTRTSTTMRFVPHRFLSDDVGVTDSISTGKIMNYSSDENINVDRLQLVYIGESNPPSQDFNLALYRKGVQVGVSAQPSSSFEFLVYNPSGTSTGTLNPVVSAPSGSGIFGIEWEQATPITLDTEISLSFSSTDAMELYQFTSPASGYDIKVWLGVPTGCNYELDVFRVTPNTCTWTDPHSSHSGTSVNECVDFTPAASTLYGILVRSVSGTATATLRVARVLSSGLPFDTVTNSGISSPYFWYRKMSVPTVESNYYFTFGEWSTSTPQIANLEMGVQSSTDKTILDTTQISNLTRWNVFRESTAQIRYPFIHSLSDSSMAYFGLFQGSSLPFGGSLAPAYTNKHAIYTVSLSSSKNYRFHLDVPWNGKFHMHVFYLAPGASTSSWQDYHVNGSSIGSDLTLQFKPLFSNTYAVVLVDCLLEPGNNAALEIEEIPETLTDGIPLAALMSNPDMPYYYETHGMSSSQYHLVSAWSPTVTFDMKVFSSNQYSVLLGDPLDTGSNVEWLVYKPSSGSSPIYPRVNTIGSTGTVYVESQSATTLALNIPVSSSLSSNKFAAVYEISTMEEGKLYNIILDISSADDLNVEIFRLAGGSCRLSGIDAGGSQLEFRQSISGGSSDEHIIDFSPEVSGATYVIVVYKASASSGAASFSIAVYRHNRVPYFDVTGDGYTQVNSNHFTYSVRYFDADNEAPSPNPVQVVIDGTPFNMTKQDDGDNVYTDGCLYIYTTWLDEGDHEHYFQASDGINMNRTPSSGAYTGPSVNHCPLLFDAGAVNPASGTNTTVYSFVVNYTDHDDDVPALMQVVIDGVPHAMWKQNPTDDNYNDGCIYEFNTTCTEGTHEYFFQASDGINQTRYPAAANLLGPTVNYYPALLSGMVTPSNGKVSTNFTYRVTYQDTDNDTVDVVWVIIDGVPHLMQKENPLDDDYTDGCVYMFTTNLTGGMHQFHFNTTDGINARRYPASGEITGPYVNHVPTLTNPQVTPQTGLVTTVFSFRVTYTDADNEAPVSILVYIDGASHSMTKADTFDISYVDGCVYQYNTTLPDTNHQYYFLAFDGNYSVRSPGNVSVQHQGPIINWIPDLSSGSVLPLHGTTETDFTYTITYTDEDNEAPVYMDVVIDSVAYTMQKFAPADNDYADGCLYYLTIRLGGGPHSYFFTTSDGINTNRDPGTGTEQGPFVNYKPTLTLGSVTPSSGTVLEKYKFIVVYTDLGNEAPVYVDVVIDGKNYSMTKQDSSENDYNDGCEFVFTTELAVGNHVFYFSTSDGNYTIRSPAIENREGPDVSPQKTFLEELIQSGLIIPIVGAITGAVVGVILKKVKNASKKSRDKMKEKTKRDPRSVGNSGNVIPNELKNENGDPTKKNQEPAEKKPEESDASEIVPEKQDPKT